MKKAIIIANTKWFVLNFKEWLIKELTKSYEVEILYLEEGPIYDIEKINHLSNLKFTKLNLRTFLKIFFNFKKADVVLAFTIFGIFISPILYPFSIKKIATIEGLGRNFSSEKLLPRFFKRIIMIYYKIFFRFFFNKIIVLNYTDICYLLDFEITPINKICYLPGTGVDTNIFSRKNFGEFKVRDKKKNIGMISRYLVEKGINKFIASKISFINQMPDINKIINYFLILPKSDINKLKKGEIDYLNTLNIKVLEYNKNPLEIYKNLDIIVQPTNYFEGLNRVILEAGSLEIPIITYHNRGTNDIIPSKDYGYLISKDTSPLSLAIEINKIIKEADKAKIKSLKLRKHIEKNFDTILVTKRFMDILI